MCKNTADLTSCKIFSCRTETDLILFHSIKRGLSFEIGMIKILIYCHICTMVTGCYFDMIIP